LHERARVGLVGQPTGDTQALDADRHQRVAPVGRLLCLYELCDAPEVAPGIATTDLVAALDQHDAEAAVAGQ
jgi:hypothetical protein